VVIKPCYLDRDLSGSDPSISYFSPGDFYTFPSRSITKKILRKEPRFSSGDVISIVVNIKPTEGDVCFLKNGIEQGKFTFSEPELIKQEWFLGVNLCSGSRVTIIQNKN
jgi:hypothetical protein